MFLHDAIGVGLFVVIAHHVGKSVGCTASCLPVNEIMEMVNKTLRTMIISKRSAQGVCYGRTVGRWSRKSAKMFHW